MSALLDAATEIPRDPVRLAACLAVPRLEQWLATEIPVFSGVSVDFPRVMNPRLPDLLAFLSLVTVLLSISTAARAEPWTLRTIDNTSKGADGVRLADVDGDGDLDVATGWEEGGVVRVYENPGATSEARKPWRKVTVGNVKSAEDAVLVDLDGDGAMDVVSSCEGKTRTLYVHWAPSDRARYWEDGAWTTEAMPVTEKAQAWMFCLPKQMDGKGGIDLLVGSKSAGAAVGWLESPEDPRELADWKYHKLVDASWIMSLLPADLDGDGAEDVVVSNRKGGSGRVYWLSAGMTTEERRPIWSERLIGAEGQENLFLDVVDLDGDERLDVAVAAKSYKVILLFQPESLGEGPWKARELTYPEGRFGSAKSVRAADLDLDGDLDLAVTCERANGELSGVFYFEGPEWTTVRDIGGPLGIKYDRIELLDLDGDGDLDLMSCEERDQLGVHWYENPAR